MRALYLVLLSGCGFHVPSATGDGGVGGDTPFDDGRDGDPDAPQDVVGPCWQYAPTNFDPCGLPPPVTIDLTGTATLAIDTDSPSAASAIRSQPGGPSVVVMHLASLNIAPAASLTITGSRPLILAVEGDVTMAGPVVTSAGANDATACGASVGGPGTMSGSNPASGGGGGGASGASNGGDGGDGNNSTGSNHGTHGAHGSSVGGVVASPLRGGCRGGAGGSNNGAGSPGVGGGGGGALQISARGIFTSSASIDAAGYGASAATARTGGGGGGAGGTIFFEAPNVTVSGKLCADGGSGSEGGGGMASGAAGGRSPCSGASGAAGGRITSFGGLAGAGGFRNTTTGGTGGTGGNDGTNGGGGGGAGGGVGSIRLRTVGGTLMNNAVITPAPTLN